MTALWTGPTGQRLQSFTLFPFFFFWRTKPNHHSIPWRRHGDLSSPSSSLPRSPPLPTAAVGDAPFVVAHKKVALSRPGPGAERLAVTLDLYNQGAATAYEIVSGSMSKIVEKLDPGATASHNFVLETKVQGRFQGSPAVIKYRVLTNAALQEAYSTPTLPLDILAGRPPQQKFEWRLVGKYVPLVSVVSFVCMFVYLVASPSKSSVAKGSK